MIQKLHEFFKCGAVRYSRSDRTYKYEVRSIADLVTTIIPHFRKHQLVGGKLNDFKLFTLICEKMHANLHRSKKPLSEIIKLAYMMNPSGKRRFDKQALLKELGKDMV